LFLTVNIIFFLLNWLRCTGWTCNGHEAVCSGAVNTSEERVCDSVTICLILFSCDIVLSRYSRTQFLVSLLNDNDIVIKLCRRLTGLR